VRENRSMSPTELLRDHTVECHGGVANRPQVGEGGGAHRSLSPPSWRNQGMPIASPLLRMLLPTRMERERVLRGPTFDLVKGEALKLIASLLSLLLHVTRHMGTGNCVHFSSRKCSVTRRDLKYLDGQGKASP
jgi:hypothetical protein